MKRLHVHVAVGDLEQSLRFYSTLFAAEPIVRKSDYAKWMLDDPRLNFAISRRGVTKGLNHLGVQVESAEELVEMHARLKNLRTELTQDREYRLLLLQVRQVLGHRPARYHLGNFPHVTSGTAIW